jgi:hypothetical protein
MLEAAQGQQATPPWRAFDGWGGAFVLLRDGAELYCQQGVPNGALIASLLLSELAVSAPASRLTTGATPNALTDR